MRKRVKKWQAKRQGQKSKTGLVTKMLNKENSNKAGILSKGKKIKRHRMRQTTALANSATI